MLAENSQKQEESELEDLATASIRNCCLFSIPSPSSTRYTYYLPQRKCRNTYVSFFLLRKIEILAKKIPIPIDGSGTGCALLAGTIPGTTNPVGNAEPGMSTLVPAAMIVPGSMVRIGRSPGKSISIGMVVVKDH